MIDGGGAREGLFDGNGETCYYCGEPCNSFAGDPGLWPILLCHPEAPGVARAHHDRCVSQRLHPKDLTDPDRRFFARRAAELAEAHCSGMGYPEGDAHTLASVIESAMREVDEANEWNRDEANCILHEMAKELECEKHGKGCVPGTLRQAVDNLKELAAFRAAAKSFQATVGAVFK